jgi:hypothetical protein
MQRDTEFVEGYPALGQFTPLQQMSHLLGSFPSSWHSTSNLSWKRGHLLFHAPVSPFIPGASAYKWRYMVQRTSVRTPPVLSNQIPFLVFGTTLLLMKPGFIPPVNWNQRVVFQNAFNWLGRELNPHLRAAPVYPARPRGGHDYLSR